MSPWRLPRSRRWAALTKANIAAPECPHGPFRRKMSRLLVAEEMQDREIEHLRVLQEGEMAHVRQDEETGMRDGRRDIFGVLALDRLVMVAVDDQDGRVEAESSAYSGPARSIKAAKVGFFSTPSLTPEVTV